jgi:hypothetical protein
MIRDDRSDPAGFTHSFDQRTYAHELAEIVIRKSMRQSAAASAVL